MKLPYFKHLYYLSGIDWIIAGIDYFMKSTTVAGNHSTLIIQLQQPCNPTILHRKLVELIDHIPLLNAKLKRDWFNLAPYWSIKKGSIIVPRINLLECNDISEFDEIKNSILNNSFNSNRDHLQFTITRGVFGDYLFMTFDHKFFDARGAEQFLHLMSSNAVTDNILIDDDKEEQLKSSLISSAELVDSLDKNILSQIKITNPPKLKDWLQKFAAGKDVQRHLIELSKKSYKYFSEYTIDQIKDSKKSNLKSITTIFSDNETKDILLNVEKVAGFMMETPYFLATIINSIDLAISYNEDRAYTIPMPIDMRKVADGNFSKMLFNHLSFLFLDITVEKKMTFEQLICEIRKKIAYNIENDLPEKLIKATRLSRIAPLSFFKRFMKLPNNGQVASFAFANLGSSSISGNILGNKIVHISHMPRVPTPPGFGIFFNRYGGKLQYTISWDKNIIDDSTIFDIDKNVKKKLNPSMGKKEVL